MLLVCGFATGAETKTTVGLVTLVNGDTFRGRLLPSDTAELIQWRADEFLDPFTFPTGAIKSIRFPAEPAGKASGQFIVQCTDGDVIVGDIVYWDGKRVVVRAESLGDLAIRTDTIADINRLKNDGRSLVTLVTGLKNWEFADGWIESGEYLVAHRPGATLNGDFQLPDRAVVDLELSWAGVADFVVALAADPAAEFDSSTDGWRLESIENQLAIVREGTATAQVRLIADLNNQTSIRLIAYIDQRAGEIRLWQPDQGKLTRISDQSLSTSGSGIRVINHGRKIELRRLFVRPWLGEKPGARSEQAFRMQLSDGRMISTAIERFDPDSKAIIVGQGTTQTEFKLAEVTSAHFADQAESGRQPRSVFRLNGGIQLSGEVVRVDEGYWIVKDAKYVDQLRVTQNQVHLVAFSATLEGSEQFTETPGAFRDRRRVGRFESNGHHHLGSFATSVTDSGDGLSSLAWRPLASSSAARLRADVSGQIVYLNQTRDRQRQSRGSAAPPPPPALRLRGDMSFGELFLQSVDRVQAGRARRDQHLIHLCSGDRIACRIESIDSSGVTLSTLARENVLIPHVNIKAIELVNKAPIPELSEAKRQRLLTLPRLQKSTPPTHLLVSQDGDFLRCRLLRADQRTVVVEVQMEELVIPRDRVTHVIWLHPNESRSENSMPDRYRGFVQALSSDGSRVTFLPTASTRSALSGISPVSGSCTVELSKINQLVLGTRIADEAADLAYSDWKLTPAKLPLVMQDSQPGGKAVDESMLLGKQAPDILLERLDGGRFQLSSYRGRILVLDFWASWCAPCIQTMPLVDQAIAAYDATKVALVAINLEERREVVRDALQRLDLDMVVALDTDGVTARPYQADAIPQTVVIDAGGKIAGVIVGGGADAVTRVKAVVDQLLNSQ